MTKKDILHFLNLHKEKLQERYSVVKIGLFGSYAKDSATKESDIDIYVEFGDKKYRNIAGTWNYLEEHLGVKIDLFYKHKNMRKTLQENIEKEVIYG
jgi:predicted nucleotidyltransferase